MRPSHIISVSIERPFKLVYAFLVQPKNYAQWAAVEPDSFRELPKGDWEGQMPLGLRHFRFTPPNPYGVLDHAIFVPGEPLLYTPMRLVPNEDGCELAFTFFRRDGMDDSQFASAIEWITTDFLALKSILEAAR